MNYFNTQVALERLFKNFKENMMKVLFGREYWSSKIVKMVKKPLLRWQINTYEIVIAKKIFNLLAGTVPSIFFLNN